MSTDNAEQLGSLEISEKEQLHQIPPHELNTPSANEISTDNAEQLDLPEIPKNLKERLHQIPPHELNPHSANEMSTDNAEQLALLDSEIPEKERLHQLSPSSHRKIYLRSANIALVLIFAIFYLAFCFIVHYRNIPIGRSGVLSLPFLHFNIDSVITTVSILIVNVALWPLMSLIDEIRAEEFFRLMHTHPNGLPLDMVNAISATTTGAFDIFMATIHHHCSPLLTSTLVISLVITATSSVAPAALSAGSIWIDVDHSTFLIGALPKDSFLVNYGPNVSKSAAISYSLASTMAWVENILNLTKGYYKVTSNHDENDQFEYIVPFPPGYTSTMKAYWTTDVIVLDPSCSWQNATITGGLVNMTWYVMLPQSNLSISLSAIDLVSKQVNMTKVSVFVCHNISSDFAVPVDGSVLFVIDQLEYAKSYSEYSSTISVDLSSIPTLKLPIGNKLAFLLCSPHVSIQTRKVWATGNGNLTLGEHQRSQGNIDFYQANYLLSHALLGFSTSSGPTTFPGQVGTDLMEKLIFGSNSSNTLGVEPSFGNVPTAGDQPIVKFQPQVGYPPAPLPSIAAVYKQVIHSAMKTLLQGAIATENVPGGYTEEKIFFTSSLGHVFTSAGFFAFLTIALVAAQFRDELPALTIRNISAALSDSDMPRICMEMTQLEEGTGEKRVLKLVPSGDSDGQFNCAYQNINQDQQ